ncbi:hypothetical protein KAR91_50920 [Candidatus Pacearchaeota archaeon]|nr:hypothetical protein [Candidatus Pacearchaeota archaeon]
MKNQFGLDVDYFKKNLQQIVRDCHCYTPGEMKRALKTLSKVAKSQDEVKK